MRERNLEARCESCPYFIKELCRRYPVQAFFDSKTRLDERGLLCWALPNPHPNDICGEHPEFFLPEGEG